MPDFVSRVCVECGESYARYDMYYCDSCGDWWCPDCWCGEGDYCHNCYQEYEDDDDCDCGGCRSYRSSHVHDYSYRPTLNFKGDQAQPMMGVELEVGGDWDSITGVVQAIDPDEEHLFLKEDGSISGLEIVTHPMTLAYAREYPFKRLLTGLRSEGCRVSDGYGLHVHVARNAFRDSARKPFRRGQRVAYGPNSKSSVHQMLWMMFMYRNTPELEKLARRTQSHWASFRKPAKGELKRKAEGERRGERYVAINCLPRDTFEMRFFKSTLQEREFYAAVEFADATVRYTGDLNSWDVMHGRGLLWPQFVKWCERHNYQALHAEITQ